MNKENKGARLEAYRELLKGGYFCQYEKCCLTLAFIGVLKGDFLRHVLISDIEQMDKELEEKTQSIIDKQNNKEV